MVTAVVAALAPIPFGQREGHRSALAPDIAYGAPAPAERSVAERSPASRRHSGPAKTPADPADPSTPVEPDPSGAPPLESSGPPLASSATPQTPPPTAASPLSPKRTKSRPVEEPAHKAKPKPKPVAARNRAGAPADAVVVAEVHPVLDLPTLDRVPADGSQPRVSTPAGTASAPPAIGDVAKASAARTDYLADPALGARLVLAGLIALVFSVGGLIAIALRRRQW